ncbi:MAG TPA: metal-dependent hydrolase [Gemmatimonadales bacterium]|nr:metal-dependent hydrolase [Gemmatimonadales bacterium]
MSRLGVSLTWLGHNGFHVAHPAGPTLVFDPWLGNPKAPPNAQGLVADASLMLLTHAHWDHITDTPALANRHQMTVLAQLELAEEMVAAGIPEARVIGFNIGGTATLPGLRATLVQAMHSSSIGPAGGPSRAVGTPTGFVVAYDDGPIIYNTGDTGVFGDMALIAELYRPDILMLPIGDFYTMGARQAAKAVELVDPTWIVPQHYDTFAGLPGTLEAFRDELAPSYRDRVIAGPPGRVMS